MKRSSFFLQGCLILFVGSVALSHSQEALSPSQALQAALNVSPSARAAGLGDSFVSVSDDSSALFFNPAGLAHLERGDLSVMHLHFAGNALFESAAYAMPLNSRCGWGARVSYIDFGSFSRFNQDGIVQGHYSAQDLSAGIALGYQLMKNLSGGVQTGWTSQNFDQTTQHGLWWNCGFLAKASPRWQFGLALKNMGVEENSGPSPFALQWGFAFKGWSVTEQKDGLLLCAGSTYSPHGGNQLNAGIEFNHQERFFFRAGYSPELSSSNPDATQGINVGGGVRFHQLQLDYTFTMGGQTGEFHRVSVSYLFPSMAPKPKQPIEFGTPNPSGHTNPSDGKFHPAPPKIVPTPALQRLQNADSLGNASNSEVDGKNLVVLPFKLEDTDLMTAEECLEKGQTMERLNKWREALKYYLVSIEKKPGQERAWLLLGNLQMRMGMDAYREALRLNPSNETLKQWLDKQPSK